MNEPRPSTCSWFSHPRPLDDLCVLSEKWLLCSTIIHPPCDTHFRRAGARKPRPSQRKIIRGSLELLARGLFCFPEATSDLGAGLLPACIALSLNSSLSSDDSSVSEGVDAILSLPVLPMSVFIDSALFWLTPPVACFAPLSGDRGGDSDGCFVFGKLKWARPLFVTTLGGSF